MKTKDYRLTEDEALIIEAYRAGSANQRDIMTSCAEAIIVWAEKESRERREKLTVIK